MNRKILHKYHSLVFVVFLILLFGKLQAQSVDIVSNPGTSGNIITGNNPYHASESIFLNSEVGMNNFTSAGTALNRIEFNISAVGDAVPYDSFKVYLKEVPAATTIFTAGTYSTVGYTLVYSGSFTAGTTGWIGINLSTSFVRTAGTNLQMLTTRLDGVGHTTAPAVYVVSAGNTVAGSAANSTRRFNSATTPTGTSTLTPAIFRPAIRLVHVNPADAALTDFVLPASSCYSTPQNVGVVVTNTGTTLDIGPGAASVALTISGANAYSATLTNAANINPGGSATINFSGINLANIGINDIQAVVTFSGDGSASNDTLRSSITTTGTTSTFPALEGAENNPLDHFQYIKTLSGNNAWTLQTGKIINTNLTDSLAPHGGNNFYIFDSYNVQNSDAILYSECLSLPAAGPSGNNYYVQFWMSHDTSYTAAPNSFLDSIYLVISTDKGATWTRLAGYQRNDPSYPLPGWQQYQYDLPAYAGQIVQIGFEGVSKYGNLIGLDDITIVAESSLPVKLVNFTGQRAGAFNQLSWATASETNNTGFELQRSADGTNFSKLNFIATKSEGGNSNRNLKYDFTDKTPFATSSYYRLKQIDKDGKFNYSTIVLVKGTTSNTLSISAIYPNPAVNNLKLVIGSPVSKKVTIVVSDLAGKIVMEQNAELLNGDNNLQLDVKSIAKGSYSIKIVCNDGCNSPATRFVKQ